MRWARATRASSRPAPRSARSSATSSFGAGGRPPGSGSLLILAPAEEEIRERPERVDSRRSTPRELRTPDLARGPPLDVSQHHDLHGELGQGENLYRRPLALAEVGPFHFGHALFV